MNVFQTHVGKKRAQPERDSRPRGARRAFTLIELLAVIGIMALIMAITVPSFIGIARSSKMRGARDNLRATLTLSRQWAITHREKTYVVFPNHINDTNKAYVAYRPFTDASGYIGEWRYLPEGIVFNIIPDLNQNVFNVDPPSRADNRKRTFPSLAGSKAPFVLFYPDGSMDRGFNDTTVYIQEGFIDSASHLPVNLNTNLMYRIKCSGRTGGLQISVAY